MAFCMIPPFYMAPISFTWHLKMHQKVVPYDRFKCTRNYTDALVSYADCIQEETNISLKTSTSHVTMYSVND